jgi:hypothetical protein
MVGRKASQPNLTSIVLAVMLGQDGSLVTECAIVDDAGTRIVST